MAVSKSKRKNNKKRAKQHRAPEHYTTPAEAAAKEKKQQEDKTFERRSWISLLVMIGSFLIAQFGSGQVHTVLQLLLYPVSMIAAMSALRSLDKKRRKGWRVSMACFIIYSVLLVIEYIGIVRSAIG